MLNERTENIENVIFLCVSEVWKTGSVKTGCSSKNKYWKFFLIWNFFVRDENIKNKKASKVKSSRASTEKINSFSSRHV